MVFIFIYISFGWELNAGRGLWAQAHWWHSRCMRVLFGDNALVPHCLARHQISCALVDFVAPRIERERERETWRERERERTMQHKKECVQQKLEKIIDHSGPGLTLTMRITSLYMPCMHCVQCSVMLPGWLAKCILWQTSWLFNVRCLFVRIFGSKEGLHCVYIHLQCAMCSPCVCMLDVECILISTIAAAACAQCGNVMEFVNFPPSAIYENARTLHTTSSSSIVQSFPFPLWCSNGFLCSKLCGVRYIRYVSNATYRLDRNSPEQGIGFPYTPNTAYKRARAHWNEVTSVEHKRSDQNQWSPSCYE